MSRGCRVGPCWPPAVGDNTCVPSRTPATHGYRDAHRPQLQHGKTGWNKGEEGKPEGQADLDSGLQGEQRGAPLLQAIARRVDNQLILGERRPTFPSLLGLRGRGHQDNGHLWIFLVWLVAAIVIIRHNGKTFTPNLLSSRSNMSIGFLC